MKKIFFILAALILLLAAGIFYLNQKVLPTKIRAAIIKDLESVTQKKVLLDTVRFDIFKGIILKDLIIRDDLNAILNVKEVRCSFPIIPLLNKKVIISRLVLESPEILLERRADYTINLVELFSEESMANSEFKTIVQRVSIRNGTINFHDLILDPLFSRNLENCNADIYFKPPRSIGYDLKFEIPSELPIKVSVAGEYVASSKELTAELKVKDFAPGDFKRYYEDETTNPSSPR